MIKVYTYWEYQNLNVEIPVAKGDRERGYHPVIIIQDFETYEQTKDYRSELRSPHPKGWGFQ